MPRFRDRDHRLMDLRLRRGTDQDAVAVSALYLRARKAAKATIPMAAHTDDEVRRWIAERVVPHTELWVAEDDGGALVGLLVLDEDWLHQLYVEPTLTGRGIGSELIGLAKRARPEGLRLWTFESNLGAQRFYERHGFRPIERTAGDNEEGAPTFSTSGCLVSLSPLQMSPRSGKRSDTLAMKARVADAGGGPCTRRPGHDARGRLQRVGGSQVDGGNA